MIEAGNNRTGFFIETKHEISLQACAGLENYGDSWMFFPPELDETFEQRRLETNKLPTTCTLSRLLPGRS